MTRGKSMSASCSTPGELLYHERLDNCPEFLSPHLGDEICPEFGFPVEREILRRSPEP